MKRILFAVALAAATVPVSAADAGMSINVGQPGFYGQIDIGGYPPPQIIYRQPRVIHRADMHRPPVYLHVPPGHSRNWRKHCHRYNACGERVYFVKNNWYDREYVPNYQRRHGHRDDDHHDGRRGKHRGDHQDGRRGNDDDRHDHDRDHRGNR